MEEPQHYKTSHALSPHFLHSVDHPGVVLVSIPLNGENYTTLKRAMKMALNAKKE
jgi:predicted YcjX-like family ATPase